MIVDLQRHLQQLFPADDRKPGKGILPGHEHAPGGGVGQRETFIAGRVGRLQQNGEIQAAVIQPLGDVRGIGAEK